MADLSDDALASIPAITYTERKEADEELWNRERECLLLLLEGRVLLRHIIDAKERQLPDGPETRNVRRKFERIMNGDLSLMEIADILKLEPNADDIDLHSELARLKRLVIQELKRNHLLEGNVSRLDLKISLLIANKSTTHDIATKHKEAWLARIAAKSEEKRRRKAAEAEQPKFRLVRSHYHQLFYKLSY